MQKSIGVLGGTFNPIHNGHLAMARAALEQCNLSKVIFLPNGNPPHKIGESIVTPEHRLNMVKLAIDGIDVFEVSDYEIKRTEPSYTVHTNRALKLMYDCPVHFIIGADSLYTLSKWYRYDELMAECSFIVADRLSCHGSDVAKACSEHKQRGGSAKLLSMPTIDVTSTDIRRIIKNGGNADEYLPSSVAKYIKAHNLYQSEV